MTDTPPEFAEDVRKCAWDSGRREAGGKDFAKQKAEGSRLRQQPMPIRGEGRGSLREGVKIEP